MLIRSFHIDGFGILSQVSVDHLPAGVSIFLGNNEAGKSTCLEFFRTMLTGYPLPRSKESRKSWAVPGPKQGGSLVLELPDNRIMRLYRQPKAGGGGFSLFDGLGNPLPAQEYESLLAGINREVYRNIYGFSLSELQNFESLNNDEVKSALYGVSFGLGLNAPAAAMDKIKTAMEQLYRPSGKNPELNLALRELEELRLQLTECMARVAEFDSLSKQLDDEQAGIKQSRSEILTLEDERRTLEKRLGVWKQWEEWQLAKTRLERLESVSSKFPQDGPARLDKLLDRLENAQRQTVLCRERLDKLNLAETALQADWRLLPLAEQIRSMSEHKSSCRSALINLPSLQAGLKRNQENLSRQMSSLGPDWNLERIHAMNRSLFMREELEQQAQAMQSLENAIVTQQAALERTRHETELAIQSVASAETALQAMPEPDTILEKALKDNLQTLCLRLEEARRRLPEREKALLASRSEYERALTYLKLRPDSSLTLLQNLTNAQERVLQMADEIKSLNLDVQNAAREVGNAQKELEVSLLRLRRLESQETDISGSDRQAIDNRRTILRRLRQSANLLEQEHQRLVDLNDRYLAQEAARPQRILSKPALIAAIVLVLLGGGMLTANLGFGLDHFNLSALLPGLFAPERGWDGLMRINPWVAYLLLFIGVVFLAMGLPHEGPDKQRTESQIDHLRSRRDASNAKVNDLRLEVQDLCLLLGISSFDPVSLDQLELQLDWERDQCASNERLLQEKRLEHNEIDARQVHLSARKGELRATEERLSAAKKRWHDYFVQLGVSDIPIPENAPSYFARVDATRLAKASAAGIEAEIEDMQGREAEFLRLARDLLPAEHVPAWLAALTDQDLQQKPDPEIVTQIEQIVRDLLDKCRLAEDMGSERVRAAEALRSAQASAHKLDQERERQLADLDSLQAQLEQARQAWRQYLNGLGLDPGLSPATTREALECMERCLSIETESKRLSEEIALQERERDALAVPLQAMLNDLGRTPHLALDRQPDWLGTLDILQRDVDLAKTQAVEQKRLRTQKEEREAELSACCKAEADASQALQSLLNLAGISDAEEFRRVAGIIEERKILERRCQDLEDALGLVAGEQSVDSFLREFAKLDKNSLDRRMLELGHSLDSLREDEQRQAARAAGLQAKLDQLVSSRQLEDLRIRESVLTDNIQRLTKRWKSHALALQLLQEARKTFERERQPEVVRLASDIFCEITAGAWPLISASLDDGSLRVIPDKGEPISPEQLSRGAQEQLYLAMRLAHIRMHGQKTTPLPVIMDDIMVNFDPSRMERTILALSGLSKPLDNHPAHQTMYFTCHPFVADKIQELIPDSALFQVEAGRIHAAG